MSSAQPGWINPQAGVTATRPTIGPTHAPEIETWPRIASITTQVTSPIAAAALVFTNAKDARPLNPKQNFFVSWGFNQNTDLFKNPRFSLLFTCYSFLFFSLSLPRLVYILYMFFSSFSDLERINDKTNRLNPTLQRSLNQRWNLTNRSRVNTCPGL